MQRWETYKDGEEYFLGNKETITVSTSKQGAQRIKDIVDGVYECSDWKCKHCGEKHVDERDYADFVDKQEEYVADAVAEIRQATTLEEVKELLEEHFVYDGMDGLDCINNRVQGDFDWTCEVVTENCDGDVACTKCGKYNNDDMEDIIKKLK